MVYYSKQDNKYYHHYEPGKLYKVIRACQILKKVGSEFHEVNRLLEKGEIVIVVSQECLAIHQLGAYYLRARWSSSSPNADYKTTMPFFGSEIITLDGLCYLKMNAGTNVLRQIKEKPKKEDK